MSTIWRDVVTCGTVTWNDAGELPLITAGEIVNWGFDVLVGWHETPDVEAEFAPKGLVDGEVPAEFFPVRGRQVTMGGYASASTRAGAEELYDVIVRDGFPRNTELEFVRHEPVPKLLKGYRNGPIACSWTGPTNFRWGVSFRAPDPLKYGFVPLTGSSGVAGVASGGRTYPRTYPLEYDTTSSGEANGVVLNVLGTAETHKFQVTLNGPLTKGGWRISNDSTGDLLKVDIGLLTTDVLLVDFETETVLLNGDVLTAIITGDFFGLKPGVNILKLYADFDPAAQISVEAFSAWE